MYPGTQWMGILIVLAFVVTIHAKNTTIAPMSCGDARLKCAYRTGCGRSLQMYLSSCSDVFQGLVSDCPEACQRALISLAATIEGQNLMNCECAKNDQMCLTSKQRIEVCRSSVTLATNKTRISCRIATWICEADIICSTALYYYHGYCRNMFSGKKCNHRCRNSINILMRQETAEKLNTCICDGREDYDCKAIHRNMELLCFGRHNHEYRELYPGETNDVSGSRNNFSFFKVNFILGLLFLLFMSQD